MSGRHRVGIDLGGTKIEGVVLDEGGTELARRRVPTPSGDYDGILAAVTDLVATLKVEAGIASASIGIGTPGSVSPATGTLRNCNSTCLNGRFFREDLERHLGQPLRMANDANCMTLSEAVDGAGAGAEVVFGVILGTGVGGGLVVHGRPLAGANGIAGEWGHNPLPGLGDDFPREGRPCYCGRLDCVETYLSGPGLSHTALVMSGESCSAEVVATRAARGDAAMSPVMALYQRQLAAALSEVINIVDPDVVVLAGGVSRIDSLYRVVPTLWGSTIFSDSIRTRLLPAEHGDASGVRGAAWLWPVRAG